MVKELIKGILGRKDESATAAKTEDVPDELPSLAEDIAAKPAPTVAPAPAPMPAYLLRRLLLQRLFADTRVFAAFVFSPVRSESWQPDHSLGAGAWTHAGRRRPRSGPARVSHRVDTDVADGHARGRLDLRRPARRGATRRARLRASGSDRHECL